MSDEKILNKIRALLAKTEGNGCTPEEAESAFAMAQRLMARHAVDEEALIASGHQTSREPIINHKIHLRHRDEVRRQRLAIIGAIAGANNCEVVDATDDYDQIWIVGHESEAFFVEILSSAVLMQFATERTRAWGAGKDDAAWEGISRFKWVTSFAWGYAMRIAERLEREADAVAGESTAGKELVFVGRKALVEDWMSANLATRKIKAKPITVIGHVADQGRDAADRADLSGGRGHVRQGAGRNAGELR